MTTDIHPFENKRPTLREKISAEIQALEARFNVVIVTNTFDLERSLERIAQHHTRKIPGAAYIRYSSVAQLESFSLDAQLRQIIERASSEGVEIVVVFADPAQSAYHKKERPAINATLSAARQHLFRCLYVHKVDRLARRIEWFIQIIQQLDDNGVMLRVVEQNVDMTSPEGKLVANLLGVLAQFYSENLSLETGKGRFEAFLQGYHNGAPPFGYYSVVQDNRKVGAIHPELGPVARGLFERYASGIYSYQQLLEWFQKEPAVIAHGIQMSTDGIRAILQNPYYTGKVLYKGRKSREKGVSYRKTPGKLVQGKHPPLISEELFERCQQARRERTYGTIIRQKTARIHLLQGIAFCSECGARLRAQTPKNSASYYRESSDLQSRRHCSKAGRGVQAPVIEAQVANLICALHLPKDWEDVVRNLLNQNTNAVDIEAERRAIRAQLHRLRDNYEMGQYLGEEYIYRQKVEALQQKLSLTQRAPDAALNQAAQMMLALAETWKWATREEQQKLVRMMFSQIACDVTEKRVVWVRPRMDFDILFQVVDGLHPDDQGRYWLPRPAVTSKSDGSN